MYGVDRIPLPYVTIAESALGWALFLVAIPDQTFHPIFLLGMQKERLFIQL